MTQNKFALALVTVRVASGFPNHSNPPQTMSSYVIGPEAQAALDQVRPYMAERVGNETAEKYMRGLFETLEHLSNGKTVGQPIPNAFGLHGRYGAYEKHIIFWKNEESTEGHNTVIVSLIPEHELPRDIFGPVLMDIE